MTKLKGAMEEPRNVLVVGFAGDYAAVLPVAYDTLPSLMSRQAPDFRKWAFALKCQPSHSS